MPITSRGRCLNLYALVHADICVRRRLATKDCNAEWTRQQALSKRASLWISFNCGRLGCRQVRGANGWPRMMPGVTLGLPGPRDPDLAKLTLIPGDPAFFRRVSGDVPSATRP